MEIIINGENGNINAEIKKYSNLEINIIIHGFATNKKRTSKNIQEKLFNAEKNSIIFDLDNKGSTDLDFFSASLSKYITQVKEVINYSKSQGFSKINLIGSSYGAYLALCVSEDLNEKEIEKLVLMGPILSIEDHFYKVFKEKSKQLIERKNWPFKNSHGELIRKVPIKTCFEEGVSKSFLSSKNNIKIPTLVLYGNKDQDVSMDEVKLFKGLNQNSTLKIIDGADHKLGIDGDYSIRDKLLLDYLS